LVISGHSSTPSRETIFTRLRSPPITPPNAAIVRDVVGDDEVGALLLQLGLGIGEQVLRLGREADDQ
jgi:hypothetical protein